MYTCYYYWLIAPLRGEIKDSPERKSAFSLNIHAPDGKEYELALYCDLDVKPEFARISIPSLDAEILPDDILPLLQSIKEHLLSALRVTFQSDAAYADPSATWAFNKEGEPYNFALSIKMVSTGVYDAEATKNVFALTFNIRELIRLYIDGNDKGIPLQYRFLSFYKLFENRFRNDEQVWDDKGINELAEPYKNASIEK